MKQEEEKNPKCVSEHLKETIKRKPEAVSWDRSYFTETLANFLTRPEHHRNFWIFSVQKFSPHIPLHTFWLWRRRSREDRGKAPWQGWFCWMFWIVVLLHDAPMLIIFWHHHHFLSLSLFLFRWPLRTALSVYQSQAVHFTLQPSVLSYPQCWIHLLIRVATGLFGKCSVTLP